MARLSVKKIGIVVIAFVLIIAAAIMSSSVVENVDGGEIHVKQARLSGDFTVRSDEGIYMQSFGKITKYHRIYDTFLSNDELDGGKGAETSATLVRFGDGGTAEVGSVTQWGLPLDPESMIKIHRAYMTSNNLRASARQWIIEVEKQTASTLKADETYNTRRAEFQQLISDQIVNGLYATEEVDVEVPTNELDKEGNVIMSTVTAVVVQKDEKGKPIVIKPGIFKEYGLRLINHSLKDIDYDETIDALIAQKKKAEQEKAVAITNAEKALQDAITAEAQGQARIAKAKADQEVEKITEVTQAEKQRDVAIIKGEQDLKVAELARLAAIEKAEQELALRRADAEANKLLVQAGLTPEKAAEIDKEKAIGIAREIAKIQLPVAMVIGGGDGGTTVDPLTAVGINQMLNIVDELGSKGK